MQAPLLSRDDQCTFIELFNRSIVNTNYLVKSCEQQVLEATKPPHVGQFKVQSTASGLSAHHYDAAILQYEDKFDYGMKLYEDIMILFFQLSRIKDLTEARVAILAFIKLRTNSPLITMRQIGVLIYYFDNLFGMQMQSSNNPFSTLRHFVDKYDEIKHSPIFKKMYRFCMYAMSLSMFDNIGLSMDKLGYKKLEQEAIRKEYHLGFDFAHTMVDTVLFICERGYQCIKTGTLDPIYHSGSQYEDWFMKVSELKRDSQFLTNPEPHGINRFKFLAELNETIERGDAIYKHASRIDDFSKKTIRSYLSDLQMIKSLEITKKAAQQDRKAPFSLLIYGASSIAKSTITNMLFHHYGKLFNLPTGAEYKYTRNPIDEYWVNFNTTQWCVQLDDIAFLNPSAASAGDPSLMEMIQVVNNVPFVPIQAALEDKGRTPMLSRFVIATTNTETLNSTSYFSCPLAVQRRLPWVIDVEPKKEYTKDGCMLDGTKVPVLQEGEYANYWNFTVKRVIPASHHREHQRATFEVIKTYDDVYEFIAWFSQVALDYEQMQDKAMACNDVMAKVVICKSCYRPVKKCICSTVQSEPEFTSEYVASTTQTILQRLNPIGDFDPRLGTWSETISTYFACLFIKIYFSNSIVRYMLGTFFATKWIMLYILHTGCRQSTWKLFYRKLGDTVQSRIGISKILVGIVSTVTVSWGVYKLANMFKSDLGTQSEETQDPEADIQHTWVDTGKPPIPDTNEREPVWYKNDYVTTSFDIPSASLSLSKCERDDFAKLIAQNCVFIRCIYKTPEGTIMSRPARATCLIGHVYVTTNHSVPDGCQVNIMVIFNNSKDGVTPNLTFPLSDADLYRDVDRDLVYLNLKQLPPRKSILKFITNKQINVRFNGYYLAREEKGYLYMNNIKNAQFVPNHRIDDLNITTDIWFGNANMITKNGHCGTLLIAETSFGPIIVGIHVLGDPQGVIGAHNITTDILSVGVNHFGKYHIQSGLPNLSAPSAERTLGPLHVKSTFRYISEGTANVFGSFVGFRPKNKSTVERSILFDRLQQEGYTEKYTKPVMRGWLPFRIAALDMVQPANNMNTDILQHCVDMYLLDLKKELTQEDLDSIYIYDDDTAINGADGVTYVDRLNMNTSTGNPWKKSKKYFVKSLNDGTDRVSVDPEIMDRVHEMEARYKTGVREHPVYCAHLKDEPVTFKKAEAGKTRVFTGAPVDFTILMRKYTLSFIRLSQNKRFLFEGMQGTIAQSLEWEQMREHLCRFGADRMFAGDYAKFDKNMSARMILAVFDILGNLAELAGWSHEEILVLYAIAEDVAFPTVDFNGDLVEFFGSNPSGHSLTVFVNGVVNSLYMRYCYTVLNPEFNCVDFKSKVSLVTYGDDNVGGVSVKAPWFNHTSIQEALKSIGITYTMADKEAESIPYIHIDQVSFLKRTWRWDSGVEAYLAPLDHDSIEKMLLINVVSKTISREVQAIQVIGTALREYFYYGRDTFESKSDMLREVVRDLDLDLYVDESTFPSWESLKEKFWKLSEHVTLKRGHKVPVALRLSSQVQSKDDGYVIDTVFSKHKLLHNGKEEWVTYTIHLGVPQSSSLGENSWLIFRIASTMIQKYELALESLKRLTNNIKIPVASGDKKCEQCWNCINSNECLEEHKTFKCVLPGKLYPHLRSCCGCKYEDDCNDICQKYLSSMSYSLSQQSQDELLVFDLELQSTDEYWLDLGDHKVTLTQKEYDRQIFTMNNLKTNGPKKAHKVGRKRISKKKTDSMVNRLFGSHKICVQSEDEVVMDSAPEGSKTSTEQNVSFNDENDGGLSHINSQMTGMEDYDYTPDIELDNFLSRPVLIKTLTMSLADTLATTTTFNPWNLYFGTAEIQRKLHNYAFMRCNLHIKVVLNASPFYYGAYMLSYRPLSGFCTDTLAISNSLNIQKMGYSQRPHTWLYPQTNSGGEMILPFFYHKSWLETTSAQTLTDFGQLTYLCYAPLTSANGASGTGSDVTVQIFAWAEDIKLCGATASLAVQSQDEYGTGPISYPASALATAMGYLSKVPIIGKFAQATSIGAGAVGKIATLFGYTNVPNVNTVSAYKPAAFPGICSPEISVPTDKLSIDPKNELSIDPGTVGLGSDDELAIGYIVKKKSFLDSTVYAHTLSPGAILFSTLVTPDLFQRSAPGGYAQYGLPPLSYAARAFANWRGDIVFTMKCVCTKFHKGRLKITYDPVNNISTSTPSFPVAFTHVWDISQNSEIEVVVPYNQATTWLSLQQDFATVVSPYSTSGSALTRNVGYDNGVLTVSILNDLSAPIASADVIILVSVRGGDNLEFAYPVDVPKNWSPFAIQSADEIANDDCEYVVTGNAENHQHPSRYLMNFGENITSFRQLLRRTNYSRMWAGIYSAANIGKPLILTVGTSLYPQYYGYDPHGFESAVSTLLSGSKPFNFVRPTIYNWLAPMYIGQRGSVIWHNNLDSGLNTVSYGVKATRVVGAPFGAVQATASAAFGTISNNAINQFYLNTQSGASGMAITSQNTNNGLSVYVPFYSKYKFHFTDPANVNIGSAVDDTNISSVIVQTPIQTSSLNSATSRLEKYFSIGTDFTFFFFLNTPVMQFVPPVAAV
jgi:hypothetical protein